MKKCRLTFKIFNIKKCKFVNIMFYNFNINFIKPIEENQSLSFLFFA